MTIKATLLYKIKESHPDKDCVVGGWNKDNVYDFTDTYSFQDGYTKRDALSYIMHDLMLIAGGGYSTKHIEVVDFIY